MRFHQTNRTPYLNRRDQMRLMILVGMIAIIVFSIEFAARPSSWYWLTGIPDGESSENVAPARKAKAHPKIDFRPDMKVPSLGPDVIRVIGGKTPADADRYKPGNPKRDTAADASARDVPHELKLAPELLDQVKDNSVGIRESERDLYYYLLAKTRDVPPNSLEQAAQSGVAFTVLMTESQNLLGEIVTVKGELRRLTAIPAGNNEFGIQKLWEGWLFNADSGTNPYCLRMTSIPDGIPTGTDLGSGNIVRVTGYFLKRYGYPAQQDRLHVAPLVLARSVHWYRPRSVKMADDLGLIPYVLSFAGILGTVITVLLWRFRSGDRQFEKDHLRRLTAAPDGAIAAIGDLPTFHLEDSLRQLASEHEAAADAEETEYPEEVDDGSADSETDDVSE